MILVKPSFKWRDLPSREAVYASVEHAGRTCYKSDSEYTEQSANEFIAMIIKRGHESVLEHVSFSCRIICDRGVSHELVRHRLASYSQESTRYCNYANEHISIVIPCWLAEIQEGTCGYADYVADKHRKNTDGADTWMLAMLSAEAAYQHLGWSPQQARSVLPNSLKTELVMTANVREWRHFFKLRASKAAHPQMREIAIPMLNELYDRFPALFYDLLM